MWLRSACCWCSLYSYLGIVFLSLKVTLQAKTHKSNCFPSFNNTDYTSQNHNHYYWPSSHSVTGHITTCIITFHRNTIIHAGSITASCCTVSKLNYHVMKVMYFLMCLFVRCSILGMHLFGCKFGLRIDSGDTLPDRKNFDSLLWATVTVFQVGRTQTCTVSRTNMQMCMSTHIRFRGISPSM